MDLLPQNTRKDKHSAGFKHGKYGKSSQISLSPVTHSRTFFPWSGTVLLRQKLESREFCLFQRLILQNECSPLLEKREWELFAFYKKKKEKEALADLRVLVLWDSAETFRDFCSLFGVLGKSKSRKEPAVKQIGKKNKNQKTNTKKRRYNNSGGNSSGDSLVAKQRGWLWRLGVLFYTCENWWNKDQFWEILELIIELI